MSTFTAAVAPSGESIVLLVEDGQGNPTGITSILASNAIQVITLAAAPAGNAFALSFGGGTTSPIATASEPPAIYLLWTFPTVQGHSYDLAVNFYPDYGGVYFGFTYGYEVFANGAIVARSTLTQTSPNQFADPGVNCPNGYPADWEPIASSVAATAATMQIRCTSVPGGLHMSAIRVQDTTAGTIAYYSVAANPDNVSTVSTIGDFWTQGSAPFSYGGMEYQSGLGTGIGEVTVVEPSGSTSAALIQAALQALPSIGPGGVSVTDLSGYGTGTYQITFTGGLANAAQPAITCADSAVAITVNSTGGEGPTLTPTGGSPILLADCLYSEGAPLPYVQWNLPQWQLPPSTGLPSDPAVQTCVVGTLPYFSPAPTTTINLAQPNQSVPAPWDGSLGGTAIGQASLSGQPIFGHSAGLSMGFVFPVLAPGTYQIAVTYPTVSFLFSIFNTPYQPSTATQFLVKDAFGVTLATYSIDQTQPITGAGTYQAGGQSWKILGSFTTTKSNNGLILEMNTSGIPAATGGAAQQLAILDAVQLKRTSADLSVVVGSGGVLNVPAGWITTASGPSPAIVNLPVAPSSPTSILPAFVPNPKTMRSGYNIEPVSYAANMLTHSNLAYLIPTMGSVQDGNGWPTRILSPSSPASYSALVTAADSSYEFADPPQGTAFTPAGKYVMVWNGTAAPQLLGTIGTTVTPDSTPKPANVAGNWQVFDITFDPTFVARPCFRLVFESTTVDNSIAPVTVKGTPNASYVVDLTDLEIYQPDPSDSTGQTVWGLSKDGKTWTSPSLNDSTYFHPSFLAKLAGQQVVRDMDAMNTLYNPVFSYAHYKPAAHANRCSPTFTNSTVAVASIAAPAAGQGWFVGYNGSVVLVTTATPHGLYDGCNVNFFGCGTATLADGTTMDLSTGIQSLIHVIDATRFTAAVFAGTAAPMTNTLTGGSAVTYNIGTNWPLEDLARLCRAVPTITELHHNVSLTIDTSVGGGAEQSAAFLAANLPSRVRVHVEVGNECWNGDSIVHSWCDLANATLPGAPAYAQGYEWYFADTTKAVHDRFDAAFAAAGRPQDVVHLYGTFVIGAGNTANIAQRCQRNGAILDEVCIAIYYNNWPEMGYEADQQPIFDRMTTGQLLDFMELNALYGQYAANYVSIHSPKLAQYGYGGAEVIAYEGAPQVMVPYAPQDGASPGSTPNHALRQRAVKFHPRMKGAHLQLMQSCQDAGLGQWAYFHIGGGESHNCWDSFAAINQQLGTGDPTLDTVNVTNPQAASQVLNEVGAAVATWAGLVPPRVTKTTTSGKFIPVRYGRISIHGFPRGMFRLVRCG